MNFRKNKQNKKDIDVSRFTSDFKPMMSTIKWNTLGFFFLGFLIPIVASNDMGASLAQTGLIVSVQTLGFLISSLIAGYLTDKVKKKKNLVFIASIGRGSSYVIIYIAFIVNSLLILGIGTFFLGFLAGFFWIPFDTIIAEKSHKNHRSYVYGKKNAENATGQVIGAVFGFIIYVICDFFLKNPILSFSPIIIYGLGNFYAGIKFYGEVNESIKFSDEPEIVDQESKTASVKTPFSLPKPMLIGLLFLMGAVLTSSINGTLAKPFINVYLVENIIDDYFIAGMIYLPGGVFATLLAPKLGKLIDKLHPALGISLISAIGALTTWLLINSTDIFIFSLLLFIDICILMSSDLIFRNLLSRISLEHRGKIMGLSSGFLNLGAVIGPTLGGLMADLFVADLGRSGALKIPFLISILVELILIPIYLVVVKFLIPHVEESYSKEEMEEDIKVKVKK